MGVHAMLEADQVSVRYGKFLAVERASLSLAAGECVALIGPNGHGKSSFVSALCGLNARQGVVRVNGAPLPARDPKAAVRAGLVLVPERRHLFPELSVRDNVLLGAYAKTRRVRADRAFQDVAWVLDVFPELSTHVDQLAGTLSGGQQQMVALARAMAAEPRIIVLDEPCLGLAEAVSRRVYEWLAMMAERDLTILLVEENPVQALQVAGRAVEMYKGVLEDPAVVAAQQAAEVGAS
jgi:branched-chain amino acid transport system ATP-binding protein